MGDHNETLEAAQAITC